MRPTRIKQIKSFHERDYQHFLHARLQLLGSVPDSRRGSPNRLDPALPRDLSVGLRYCIL